MCVCAKKPVMSEIAINDKKDHASSEPLKLTSKDGVLGVNRNKSLETATEINTALFAVDDDDVFNVLLTQATSIMPAGYSKDDSCNFITSMLLAIKPQDAIEAMLVTQMIATHSHAMEFSRRAMLPGQSVEGVTANINRATKLQRTFVLQAEALQKKRGKNKQVTQVQHVNVNDGGHAIVGNIGVRGEA